MIFTQMIHNDSLFWYAEFEFDNGLKPPVYLTKFNFQVLQA